MPDPIPASTAQEWRHEDIVAGDVRLHVVRAGEGPAVVLLHGFPEFWFSWRYQIGALVDAGFSVVAPDMRGFNTSEKPHGIAAYDIDALVADVVALVDRTCDGRAFLVGHDWGGIVAWYAAMRHPEHFAKLIVINAPHPFPFARDFWTTRQWIHSLYGFLFQVPRLPEALIRARNWRSLDDLFGREVYNPDAFSHGEVGRYKEAMGQPGALTSAIHYYRALSRRWRRLGIADIRPIEIPTLLLWGERDPHLLVSLTEGLESWIADLTVERVAQAGHWLQLDEPELVSRRIGEFFRAEAPR
jgi:pimeloyl-ACP methyl ester carboxylesterase